MTKDQKHQGIYLIRRRGTSHFLLRSTMISQNYQIKYSCTLGHAYSLLSGIGRSNNRILCLLNLTTYLQLINRCFHLSQEPVHTFVVLSSASPSPSLHRDRKEKEIVIEPYESPALVLINLTTSSPRVRTDSNNDRSHSTHRPNRSRHRPRSQTPSLPYHSLTSAHERKAGGRVLVE